MIAIGRYLFLIISLVEMTLSDNRRFSDTDIAAFLENIFSLHNGVRFKHGVLPLLRTVQLENVASNLIYGLFNSNFFLSHNYGIYQRIMHYDDDTQLDVEEAKKFFLTWYEQGNFYDYNNEPNDYVAVGRFTQIIWAQTTMIGLAFKCEDNRYIVLAVYDPPGNVIGEYTENIYRPRSDRQIHDPANRQIIYKTETEKFVENMLELHNNARKKHRASSLIHDIDLDPIAYALLKNGQTTHPLYGVNCLEIEFDENIKLGDEAVANEVFSKWYDEWQYYDCHNHELLFNNSGSFTQIVWYNTKRVGVCYIKINNNRYQFMVLYDPPGNIPWKFASNVFVPRSFDLGESSGDN